MVWSFSCFVYLPGQCFAFGLLRVLRLRCEKGFYLVVCSTVATLARSSSTISRAAWRARSS